MQGEAAQERSELLDGIKLEILLRALEGSEALPEQMEVTPELTALRDTARRLRAARSGSGRARWMPSCCPRVQGTVCGSRLTGRGMCSPRAGMIPGHGPGPRLPGTTRRLRIARAGHRIPRPPLNRRTAGDR